MFYRAKVNSEHNPTDKNMFGHKLGLPIKSLSPNLYSQFAAHIANSTVISLDTETGYPCGLEQFNHRGEINFDNLTPETGTIKLCQIYIPTLDTTICLEESKGEISPSNPVFAALLNHIADKQKTTVIHNALYEADWFLYHFGVYIVNPFCTLVAHQFATAGLANLIQKAYGTNPNTLKTLCARLLGLDISKSEQLSNWGAELTESQKTYAALDPYLAYRCYLKLVWTIETEAGLAEQLCLPVFAHLNRYGIPADIKRLNELLTGYTSKADKLYRDMLNEVLSITRADKDFESKLIPKSLPKSKRHSWEPNLNSPKQLLVIINELCRREKLPQIDSTNSAILETVHIPFVAKLKKYRTINKLSQYAKKFIENYNPKTGRVRCRYRSLAIQATGRSSASDGSLQIVANTSDLLAKESLVGLKQGFSSHHIDKVFYKSDFAASHLAIATALSQDETLMRCAVDGEKVHYHTMSKILGLMGERLSYNDCKELIEHGKSHPDYYRYKGLYTVSKNTIYSFLNFAGGTSLQATFRKKSIEQTVDNCKLFLEACKQAYPGLFQYQKIKAASAESTINKVFDKPTLDYHASRILAVYGVTQYPQTAKFLGMGSYTMIDDGRKVFHAAIVDKFALGYAEDSDEDIYTSRPSQVVSSFWLGIEATIIKRSARELFDTFIEHPEWDAEIVGFAHDELPIISGETYKEDVKAAISTTFERNFRRYAPHYKGDAIEELVNWEVSKS